MARKPWWQWDTWRDPGRRAKLFPGGVLRTIKTRSRLSTFMYGKVILKLITLYKHPVVLVETLFKITEYTCTRKSSFPVVLTLQTIRTLCAVGAWVEERGLLWRLHRRNSTSLIPAVHKAREIPTLSTRWNSEKEVRGSTAGASKGILTAKGTEGIGHRTMPHRVLMLLVPDAQEPHGQPRRASKTARGLELI